MLFMLVERKHIIKKSDVMRKVRTGKMERRKGKCSRLRNHQAWNVEREAASEFPGTVRRPVWF